MKSFEKVIGYESVKNELYQIIDMFKNKEMYERIGAKLPKGVLIYGAPGLGKTMIAEALIAECNVETYVVKNNSYDRELIKEVNNAFALAAKAEKAIVFLDDLDKYCETSEEDVDSRVFVSIQADIDSVKDKDILIVATVNNIDKLPQSLRRNGRFDRKLYLKAPSNEDACKIIEHYLKVKKIDANLNVEDVAKMINYTSCADLETILNESAILATFARKDAIDIKDIVKAYVRSQYHAPNEEFECSHDVIAKTALHEAGHVVIAESLKKGSVGFVTIQAHDVDEMKGFTHICERFKRRPENILISLAGKVACEQFYEGRCASGCYRDLSQAIGLISDGIRHSGTNGVGMLNFSEFKNAQDEAATIAEVERYLFIVKDILLKNKEFLFKVASELEDKKSLLYSDIKRIRNEYTIYEYCA